MQLDGRRALRPGRRGDELRHLRQPPTHRLTRHGPDGESPLAAGVAIHGKRDGGRLGSQHGERFPHHRAQHLIQLDDGADGAAHLVHGHELAYARRQALLVLLEALDHHPKGLRHITELVGAVDTDLRVQVAKRDGERRRVQIAQGSGEAAGQDVGQADGREEDRDRAERQGQGHPPSSRRQGLTIECHAQDSDPPAGGILDGSEGDGVRPAPDLERHDG